MAAEPTSSAVAREFSSVGSVVGDRDRNALRAHGRRYRARVLAYVAAIVVALLVIPVTNGSIATLADLRFRRVWLLVAGLGLQIALEVVTIPRSRYEDVGVAILLASYLALLGFAASNVRTRGFELITLGIALNALVIALNLGMPYRVANGLPRETTVKHRPNRSDDLALFLSDQIVLGAPVGAAISVGDLALGLGIVELAYFGSRRPRRRGSARALDLTGVDEIDLRELPPTRQARGVATTTRSNASSTRRS
jgi:hypothetical protein